MILGNDSFNQNNNFQNKMNTIKENASKITPSNMAVRNTNKYTDINNKNEMLDKSLQMLQDRLNNGLISYDDFQKQCAKLGKLRK